MNKQVGIHLTDKRTNLYSLMEVQPSCSQNKDSSFSQYMPIVTFIVDKNITKNG